MLVKDSKPQLARNRVTTYNIFTHFVLDDQQKLLQTRGNSPKII